MLLSLEKDVRFEAERSERERHTLCVFRSWTLRRCCVLMFENFQFQSKILYNSHINLVICIQDYTEEENIEKIIFEFKNRERENFAIYQLLAEYCAENVTLAKDLEKTRQELGIMLH